MSLFWFFTFYSDPASACFVACLQILGISLYKFIFSGNDDFEIFDEDNDGHISSSEWIEKFVSAMNSTGITSMVGREMNAETFRVMFNDIDCEKDGNISPTEFKMLTNGEFCLQERWTWCIFGCCKPWWWWLWKVGWAIIKAIWNC